MVDFSVFNELSLLSNPKNTNNISIEKQFESFFLLLGLLKKKGLKTIRMEKDLKECEILPNTTFYHFFNQVKDRDFKERLRLFKANDIIQIDSPLIMSNEEENEQLLENEYFYNNISTNGGLACCDIWNTITISFNSSEQWNRENIILRKQTILDVQKIDINIRHASKINHLDAHQDFFQELEEDTKLGIKQDNFWEKRKEFFPNKIIFCKEVEKQIKKIDKVLFQQAIGVLRDIESGRKCITEYKSSGEKETVKTNPKMIAQREFTIKNKKVFFENHIKSLVNASRIYFLEQEDKIYIGYIGSHLSTKKNK